MNGTPNGIKKHVPVLLDAVLGGLDVQSDGVYIDGTFGRGGHSKAILDRLGATGRLLAIDRDPDALAESEDSFARDPRVELIRSDFAKLDSIAVDRQLVGRVDGVLLDLGVSSPQLDRAERGFSFQNDGPLDMRMDPERGFSAAEWLRNVDEKELSRVLRVFGEETHARRIARAIVAARNDAAIETTGRLAEIVSAAVPPSSGKRHPATRSFQALRIFVNDELEQLQAALRSSLDVLKSGGRLCVISFHSLEDRIVKRFMRDESRESPEYRGMPNVPEEHRARLRIVGKAVTAEGGEVAANPRSRSARLRVAEKL